MGCVPLWPGDASGPPASLLPCARLPAILPRPFLVVSAGTVDRSQ